MNAIFTPFHTCCVSMVTFWTKAGSACSAMILPKRGWGPYRALQGLVNPNILEDKARSCYSIERCL
jgi:hypothetical protein